ncbi:MAG TPA: AI-2E family transporter [Candidatus Nanoarchaeia archaeon]|nr:AI-2E family transporter [Candidatus Nanoarchaeia archaeon]
MEFGEKEIRRLVVILLIVTLGVLVFLIIRPVLVAILGGLLLGYVFFPLYKKTLEKVREPNTAAALISVMILVAIVVPLWYLIPLIAEQVFEIFKLSQTLDIGGIIRNLFPSASDQIIAQLIVTATSIIGTVTSSLLSALTGVFIELPSLALHLFIVAFVFFFTLRDSEKLSEMISAISPFNKTQEKEMVKQFKGITDSLIYGQVIVGLVQGILAGLGFLIFGVSNALVLSVLAIFFSIIPFIGPAVVWAPVTIYFFASGNVGIGIAYLLYNLLLVSTIDNVLRSYIVSRKSDISQAVIMVGMIGGLFVFGFLGLILGPLILAYFVTFLKAYKDKTLSSLFSE